MKNPFLRRRSVRLCQSALPFMERRLRRERQFKRAIVVTTCLAILASLRVFPWGRYLVASIETSTKRAALQAFGVPRSRAEIDESWRNYRRLGIETTRPRVEEYFARSDPAFQKLMRHVGMDPEHGLLRWGNHDWILLFSSKVFEADDTGRSYRFRPGVRSIWLKRLAFIAGAPAFYLVPDDPGLAEAIRGTGAIPVESSRQTTNSWGVRGPEPEPDAPLRGIVLGDSYMQGLFVGDDNTPPECLRRYLQRELKQRVSVLNTGVMGYSPEQYYYSLLAFADRFRPHFVIVSVFANDGGGEVEAVTRGEGDWFEAAYWLQEIVRYCGDRGWTCLIVAAPFEFCLLDRRQTGYYPGLLVNRLKINSQMFLDPMDDFLDAHLDSRIEVMRKGGIPQRSYLYNDAIDDGHFSAAGSEAWATSVGRRLIRLMEHDRLSREDRRSLAGRVPNVGAGGLGRTHGGDAGGTRGQPSSGP
jgi:lysophospholipase L1-like esterase